MKIPAPNRVAVYLTTLAGLCTAAAPAVANLDLTSTAGAAVGFAGIVAVASKYLSGWQKYEARQGAPPPFVGSASNSSATITAGDEVPGQTEGVKAEGFLAPGEAV